MKRLLKRRTFRLSLAAAAVIVALHGCGSSPFMKGRRADFSDCFKGNCGLGLGLYVRARAAILSVPIGAHASWRWGNESPSLENGDNVWPQGDWLDIAYGLGVAGRTHALDGISFAPGGGGYRMVDNYVGLLAWREDDDGERMTLIEQNAWIEAEVFLAVVGVELGFNPVELADYVAGWFGVDFLADDEHKPASHIARAMRTHDIHRAMREGAPADVILRMIVACPALVEARESDSSSCPTPLHLAVIQGRQDLAELLLDKGADVNALVSGGWTALHSAARNGRRDLVELLLQRGAIMRGTEDGRTPINCAEAARHAEVVELLLDKIRDSAGRQRVLAMSLLHAAEKGRRDLVARLIKEDGDMDVRDKDEQTPLHRAAFRGHAEVAALLLANGADANARDEFGFTPLLRATTQRHRNVVELILANGGDVNARPNPGVNAGVGALHVAAERGDLDTLALLLGKGKEPNVNMKDDCGYSPLHGAAFRGRDEAVQLLLENGAGVNAKCNSGQTPLIKAAENGHANVGQLLLDKGADLVADNSGYTALHGFAASGHVDIVRQLLEKGADPHAKNSYGSPLDFATNGKHHAVARLLREHAKEKQEAGSKGHP